jgi:hypothetical protein
VTWLKDGGIILRGGELEAILFAGKENCLHQVGDLFELYENARTYKP